MAEHPEVFISSTTRDLESYREEIQNALLTLNIFPIQQDNFSLAYGPLTEMLQELIGRCDAVIHLAGFYYGAEPPQRPLGDARRSYTQIEYDIARKLAKPLFLFLATRQCQTDETFAQTVEEEDLQTAHRQAIETCGDIYYRFSNHEEVASRVRELRFPVRGAEVPHRVADLPYNSLGPLFKGRDASLVELRQQLRVTSCQVIHGLGGVGKTRFAIEYAWRLASDYRALLFVGARLPASLKNNLSSLCNLKILNLPEQNRAEEEARLGAVFQWLSDHSGWLLILDGVDTAEAANEVENTLPKLVRGHVIITSRIADWSATVQTAQLHVLTEADAAAFLLERTASQRRNTSNDPEGAAFLARELGGLALALEQAGAYIGKNRFSFTEYRQRWVATREVVLAWYDERLMKYPSSVAATWQTTVDQLAWPERGLLNMLAWFASEPIPVSLLEGVSVDTADARDALSGLVSWSLAGWTAGGDHLTVHRLVQEITRQRLFEGQKESSLAGALKILDAKLPSPDWNQKDWEMWERLASHCRALVGHLSDYVLEPKAKRMMNLFAGWLRSRAEYGEAASVFERSLALTEMELGPENPEVAISLNNLAVLYKDQGYYAKAEDLYKRALAIDEKALGPDDESVATTLNNLARLWHAQGQYAKAEPLYERAVAIWKKAGPENTKVATGFNNLAQLYNAQGQSIKAKPLLTQALAIREKVLDPDHPDLATNLNDLAQLYADEGDYAKAEPLLQRALTIWENALGPNHPHLAIGLSNLALLYIDQGSFYAKAEPLLDRVLSIQGKVLGRDHPELAAGLDKLGSICLEQGRYERAESLYRRAQEIRERTLGPDHPDLARSLTNLAILWKNQGHYDKSERLYEQALKIQENALGPDHDAIAASLNNLAALYRAQGHYYKAEPLHRRALAVAEERLGPDHPDVAKMLSNLAELLTTQGRYDEAEPLHRRALAVIEKRLGLDHLDLATILNNLAQLLQATNRFDEAEHLSRRHLEILFRFSSTGHAHRHLHRAVISYSALLRQMGRSPAEVLAQLNEIASPFGFRLNSAGTT